MSLWLIQMLEMLDMTHIRVPGIFARKDNPNNRCDHDLQAARPVETPIPATYLPFWMIQRGLTLMMPFLYPLDHCYRLWDQLAYLPAWSQFGLRILGYRDHLDNHLFDHEQGLVFSWRSRNRQSTFSKFLNLRLRRGTCFATSDTVWSRVWCWCMDNNSLDLGNHAAR